MPNWVSALGTPDARTLVFLSILFLALALAALVGRFYSRWLMGLSYALDDWLMLGGLFFYFGHATITTLMVVGGGSGYHINDLDPENVTMLFKLLSIVQFPYGLTMALVRVSICTLLIKVFALKSFRYAVYGLIVFNILWLIFVLAAAAAVCQPYAFNWDKTIPDGKCGNQDNIYVGIASWAIICDMVMWALPLPIVWKLKIGSGSKAALTGVFALGLIDIVISILRIVNIKKIDFEGDFSYTLVNASIWTITEPGIAILVGCGPVLRPVIDKLTPLKIGKFISWSRSTLSSSLASRRKSQSHKYAAKDQFRLISNNSGPALNSSVRAPTNHSYPGEVEITIEEQPSYKGEGINIESQYQVRSNLENDPAAT